MGLLGGAKTGHMCTEEREPQVGLSPSQMHNIRNQWGRGRTSQRTWC